MPKKAGCTFCKKARRKAKQSPCPCGKTTGATLEKDGVVLGVGHPVCAPWGFTHGNPIQECPYKDLQSQSRRIYCNIIDAEPIAILDALQKGYDPRGATLHLTGHFWPCRSCEALLLYFNISVHIDSHTATTNPECQHRPNGTAVREKLKQ